MPPTAWLRFAKALGWKQHHIRIDESPAKTSAENTEMIAEELAYKGVSVIIAQRECIQTGEKEVRKR